MNLKTHKPAAFFSPPFRRVCTLSCKNPQPSCNLRTLIPEPTRCSTMFDWPATNNKIYNGMKSSVSYSYRPPTKLREGNVFTGVCHSVHMGEGGRAVPPRPYSFGTIPSSRTVPPKIITPWTIPLLPERQKQSVRILLECFLVLNVFGIFKM